MRNIKLLALTFITALSTSIWAQKTYTFDDGVALATDWTVADNTSSVGGTAKCEIAAPSKFSAKNDNYLLFSFENKSGITISITSTASFSNISNITFDVVANDNSKPNFTLDIVDDSGNVVKNIYSNKTSKTDFNTGGTNKWGVSNSDISPVVTGHIKLTLTASSSGKYAAIDNLAVTYQAGPPPASTDATLSSIVYGTEQTPVPNFSADQLSYEVELPADYVGGAPSVQVTTSDANATTNITQATTLPGVATIVVTAEDGTTTKTYTVTFTKESADPKVESATWPNIRGTAVIDQVNKTITGQVLNGSSLSLEPTFTGKYLNSQSPTGVQNFANGAISYTFTSASNAQTVYSVTITESPAVSTDATLSSLTYGGKSVPNFSPSTLTYNIELTAGIKTPPTIAATPNDNKATMNITQASSVPGVGKVEVTAEDGTTKLTYTINYTVQVPGTDLSIHVPEIYEAKVIAGGYNTPLSVVAGREYEVYYTQRTGEGDYPTFSTTLASEGKATGISGSTSKTENVGRDGDKWFQGTVYSHSECKNATDIDEFDFETKMIREHRLSGSDTYKFHVKGFDQFSLWGMDKKLDPKNGNQVFVVKIDGVEQATDASLYNTTAYTVRRYNMTTGEHLIEISTTCTGSNVCYMGGFSLRVAQEPRTKWLKGNDSTQTVMQTTTIKPVTYVTKYNNIPGAETRLEWIGTEATNFTLQETEGSLTDTLTLSGTAMCAVGTYKYKVVAYYNGVETSSATGSFMVKSDIKATSDLNVEVYQNEEMDQITFNYFALDASAVQLTWPQVQPAGVTGNGNNGKYVIGGTPTAAEGTYPFQITVEGADTVISGTVKVRKLDYGANPVLYLYKNKGQYEKDGVYEYLQTKNWNMIARKQKEDGLRPSDQYSKYKWILISEDADANNEEVLALISGGTSLPVLNMNAFSYANERNEVYPNGWGEADNGSIAEGGKYITVQRDDHPIFNKLMKKNKGDRIQVLDTVTFRGMMPINVKLQGTLCLATSPTRNIEDYEADGEMQTIIHEIPAGMRGGAKYICFPLSKHSSNNLTADGKKLLDAIITYLQNSDPTVTVPEVQINSFTLNGINGTVNQANNTIHVAIDRTKYPDIDLVNAQPVVTLADIRTTVTPASGQTVNLSTSAVLPVKYTVTDYINRRVYNVTVTFYDPQGIDELYTAGEWVNIYDMFGRKVVTTNQDIYTMDLPRGVYIIVNENGNTFKITR